MENRKEIALFLRRLALYKGLSDGAKVTFLEFLYHFWSEDKTIPSYTQLSELRSVVRSTVQLHVEELEQRGLIEAIRLPDNRKKYHLRLGALNSEKLNAAIDKRGRQKPLRKFSKPVAKYTTAELMGYFAFSYAELSGQKYKRQSHDYMVIRKLQNEHGSGNVVKAIDWFKKVHVRRYLKFNVATFAQHIGEYAAIE